jgi:zinc transport system permease protein
MIEILQFEFMRHAILAGLLVSFICGVMGTLAVANRMVFLSGGIAHAAYGGIGLAFLLRWPYLLGTLGFSLLAAIVMAAVSMNIKHRADAVIGAVWALGMALGIIFTDLSAGYPADLMGYLFGSILAVPRSDLWVMAVVAVIIMAVAWFYYTDFLALSYDEEFARIRRVPVKRLYYLLVILLTLAVVLTIRVVGLILVIALLTIPPFIAEKFTRSLLQMMAWSCVLSACFTVIGLTAAFYLNLTAGACIILAAGSGFFISMGIERLRKPRPRQRTDFPQTR